MATRADEYMDANDLVIVGLDTDDDETHPLYDERAFREVEEEFVRNILFFGVNVPVLVRREGGKVYVVDGRQRVKGARKATALSLEAGGYGSKVPVREVRGSDKIMTGVMVTANENRYEDSVLEKAVKAVRMLAHGQSEDEVAIAFKRSVTTIRSWVQLTEADPRIHEAIRDGRISTQAGVEIAKAPRSEQTERLDKLLAAHPDSRVPESAAKRQRQQAESTSSSSSSAAKKATQKGVTRGWIRKALKTSAAEGLDDEQRSLLHWIATGESDKGTWWDDFFWAASEEIGD